MCRREAERVQYTSEEMAIGAVESELAHGHSWEGYRRSRESGSARQHRALDVISVCCECVGVTAEATARLPT